jgi:Zn-dependent M28 family amino/carboxypeptidase
MLNSMPVGETPATLSIDLPAAAEKPVVLRNVIGVLPGSDPELKSTYILVTAHYDHIGTTTPENGDGIYNGANDDASGTASVMELASMFASLDRKPKRTLVFMTVFGEEEGLLGAMYYSHNPVFPLSKTIVNVNLEHMGRTDSSEGPQINKMFMTGYDFSNLADVFQLAGKQTGVEMVHHPSNSDAFFDRSDNAAFAQFGVPAHTLGVAFEFPDYHGLGDHWEKIDYENMARVNRTVATAVWMLAESADVPQWRESVKTEKYRDARKAEGNKSVQ